MPGGPETELRAQFHTTESGYVIERRHHECQDCAGCPSRSQCTRSEANRQLVVSFELRRMSAQAWENLLSEEGKALRSASWSGSRGGVGPPETQLEFPKVPAARPGESPHRVRAPVHPPSSATLASCQAAHSFSFLRRLLLNPASAGVAAF